MSVNAMLPLGLAFIMFSVGLGLRIPDFVHVFHYPRAIFAGLINQIVLLPLIGAALIINYDGPAQFALGLMVLAASPGGITSNLLTTLAGGNVALSVSMTAITSLGSLVTVPLVLGFTHQFLFGTSQEIVMPAGRIMASILVVTTIPIILGMTLNAVKPKLAEGARPYARRGATLIFVLIVISAFAGQMNNITMHFMDIGLRLAALNVATMALGVLTAKALGLSRQDSIAISLECGLQNAALAIFIAVSVLNDPVLVVPAITYALIMNVTAAGYITWLRRPRACLAEE